MVRFGSPSATGACFAVMALALGSCSSPETAEDDPALTAAAYPRAEQPADCPVRGAAIQVLGSGGPIAESSHSPPRASTSYLLRIDNEPRLLIDAGAGSFLRFSEAGASISTLDAILISHLHVDHVGDLVGVLNSGGFEGRAAPLPVIGPDGLGRVPATSEFLTRLLDKEVGAFSYNGGYLDGSENKPLLVVDDVPTDEGRGASVEIFANDDFSVTAIPVHHGPVPALGFVISVDDKTVIIAGDQSAFSQEFETRLSGSRPTILFAHHAINSMRGQPIGLHRTPGEIGVLAAALEPDRMVLSHIMERAISRIDDNLIAIGEHYSGPVNVAEDLDCYAI